MNKRTKDIVGELIRTDQTLTISDLSTHFGVSERTIRNDLNNINDWLGQNGLSLIKLGSNGRIESVSYTHLSSYSSNWIL